ncbi:hypothetical protein BHM03_00038727 [Ensete ventricosum]|uniref:Uncharacterized protein n=1 Tax=Ensete ventricosum TaxID=4639 RepID=A0A445MKC8_ENSVE|nr:hypothetical protein BHM03_00038727 [Ensete ventricosum]
MATISDLSLVVEGAAHESNDGEGSFRPIHRRQRELSAEAATTEEGRLSGGNLGFHFHWVEVGVEGVLL